MIWFFVAAAVSLPDPTITPGVIDPACNVETLKDTSTKARRMTSAGMKALAYTKYGLKPHQGICAPAGCEVDHRVPLEVCGADDQFNLWVQPYSGPCNAHAKDELENATKEDVTTGRITLQEGQARFTAPDWTVEYAKRFGKECQ